MSEHTNALEDVRRIIAHVKGDEETRFEVDDYEFSGGLDQQTTLTITLTQTDNVGLSPNTKIATKKCIAILEQSVGENPGVPVDSVIETVAYVNDVSESTVKSDIDKLRTLGEVYEPKGGYLRTT
jgi:hypothetical protein